jgi:YbbR domain-containing protein
VYWPPAGSVPPAEHFAFGLQAVVGAAIAAELEDDVELEAVELEDDEVEVAADELELEDDVELEAVELEVDVELEAVELETTTLLAKLEFGASLSPLEFASVLK